MLNHIILPFVVEAKAMNGPTVVKREYNAERTILLYYIMFPCIAQTSYSLKDPAKIEPTDPASRKTPEEIERAN